MSSNRVACASVFVGAILAAAGLAQAIIINVPGDQPTIQAGINAAASGDEVVVAPGVYVEQINFADPVTLIAKSIIVRSSGGAAVTIIDRTGQAPNAAPAVRISNSTANVEAVNATLQGFTILNAVRSTGSTSRGGGLIMGGNSGQIFIRDCIFQGCGASTAGGAVDFTGGSATIDNCTFIGNKATTTGIGGAITVRGTFVTPDYTGLTIQNSTFTGNFSDGNGGAINIEGVQSPTIRNCTFTNNLAYDVALATRASGNGGAINFAQSGSQTTQAIIENCTFTGNQASLGNGPSPQNGSGGAINISLSSNPIIRNNTFFQNSSPRAGGGAIHLFYDQAATLPIATATIRGNEFISNTADTTGAAIIVGRTTINGTVSSPVEISNNLFVGNTAGGRLGGPNGNFSTILVLGGAHTAATNAGNIVNIINNTFEGNRGLIGGATPGGPSGTTVGSTGGATINFTNNILRGGTTDANGALVAVGGTGLTATYNNIQNLATTAGGAWVASPGNSDLSTSYVDPDGADNTLNTLDDDYSLAAGSAGIDAGSNAAVPSGVTTDFGGGARFVDDAATADTGLGTAPIVDQGYDEFGVPAPACVADVDDGSGNGTPDGGVGIEDLLYYLSIFEAGTIGADVDDGTGTGTPDGGVGIEDLLYYLARFEAGC